MWKFWKKKSVDDEVAEEAEESVLSESEDNAEVEADEIESDPVIPEAEEVVVDSIIETEAVAAEVTDDWDREEVSMTEVAPEPENMPEPVEVPVEVPEEVPEEVAAEPVVDEDGRAASVGPDDEARELEESEKTQEKKSFFQRLKEGLAKTRDNIVKGMDRLFTGSSIDDDFYEELEEILIMGDIGVNATTSIIERLKQQVKERHLKETKECKEFLIQSIREQMEVGETAYDFETKQSIIMVIGVNGVGKTTTVGKLAWKLKDDGKKVLIAAADTFRAAAGDQLAEWARRAGVPMIGGKEGADPASVVFDAVNAAKARNVDVLLIDTAGRLHNKKNLMEELRKMNRIIDKEYPDAHRENLIVLDGTTGQNALAQAREFGDVTNLTGIVLTKMDGTAKGGIAVAIQSELGIPVKYIGVGETTQDLQKFNPDEFVRALFEVDLNDQNAAEE